MLYIHSLNDLNPKNAEVESLTIIRDLKRTVKLPITSDFIRYDLSKYLYSKDDIELISKNMGLIEEIIDKINNLSNSAPIEYDATNISRSINALKEMREHLKNNILYSIEILSWQEEFYIEITTVLNKLPIIRERAEKQVYEQKIKSIFKKILRTDQGFMFNFYDICDEGQVSRIKALIDSMKEGHLIHSKLKDEMVNFKTGNTVQDRIPTGEQEKINSIIDDLNKLKLSIDKAYEHNMKIVTLAVVLYSYIKWLNTLTS